VLEVGQARWLGAAQAGQRAGAVAGRARRSIAGGGRGRAHPCTHVVGDLPGSGRRRRAVARYRPARVEAFQHGWPLSSGGRGDGEPRHCWALYKGAWCCCRRLAWAGRGALSPAVPPPRRTLPSPTSSMLSCVPNQKSRTPLDGSSSSLREHTMGRCSTAAATAATGAPKQVINLVGWGGGGGQAGRR
jgi:hypothetical protein